MRDTIHRVLLRSFPGAARAARLLPCVVSALIVALLHAASASVAFAQELAWVTQAGGAGFINGRRVAVDAAGTTYVVGTFNMNVTLGIGEPNETTLTSAGSNDSFVARYDASGLLVWARSAGGPGNDQGLGIAIDAAGNSYITGPYNGTMSFGGGATTLADAGQGDIYIAKYDANGTFVWAKRAGGTFSERGWGIAAEPSGTIYVTGSFSSVAATFGPGDPNQTVLNRAGGPDVFLAKYDTNGVLIWARRAGGTSSEEALSIAIDAAGHSYIAGVFLTTVTFGPGQPTSTTFSSAGGVDLFVAKYDSAGTLVWAKRAGGTTEDQAWDIDVDASGFSYIAGNFRGVSTFGAGEPNQTTLTGAGSSDHIFVARYDANGALSWAKSAIGDTGGASNNSGAGGIAVDDAGRSVITGNFFGHVTFGSGEPNETVLTASGGPDDGEIFVAGYDTDGSVRWAVRAGGIDADGDDNRDEGFDVTIDSAGRQYVTGVFTGISTFGPGDPNETTLTSIGTSSNPNMFVAKYAEPDAIAPVITCDAPDGLWHAADVSIACTASDSGSGLGNPADASFSLVTNVAAGTETPNAATDSRIICDVAGNCATAGPIAGNMIDKKAPVIVITTPANGAVYQLGEAAIAAYSCGDSGSGVASCTGTSANGGAVDTATLGTKNFTVNTSDAVGNVASQMVTYDVRRTLSAVQSATLWTGYPSLLSLGLRLDLRAELLLNGVVVGIGTLDNVPAGTGLGLGGFNDAVLQTVTMTLTSGPVDVPAGATLSLRASARRSCTGGGGLAASARFWFDGQPVDAGANRDAGSRVRVTLANVTSDFFARDLFALSPTAGTSRQSVDATLSGTACPARPYVAFGTWTTTF
jgi:hypothetical protein